MLKYTYITKDNLEKSNAHKLICLRNCFKRKGFRKGNYKMDHRIIDEYFQGASLNAYDVFGAHFTYEYNQNGARFTVYAPNAAKVALIGDFNNWKGYDMERLPSGIWTIFVNGITEMATYKYRIFTKSGEIHDRVDPFAFYSELRPNKASIVYSLDNFAWSDHEWMTKRTKNHSEPMNIYEVHLGSWKTKNISEDDNFYNYEELKETLIPYVKEMGYTHIELLPLTEYPFDGSWGYQVTGYYSATSRYGEPKELMSFINSCHMAGIGVILDFVPVHFVSDFYALHQYDGGFLYESEYLDQRYSEWGTLLFDFTKPHVISFLKSSINFWISYYHIDGIRYDAVSNLIYNRGREYNGLNEPGIWFLKSTNYALREKHPKVMLIAEDSSDYAKVTAPVAYGGLGFDYKWNLGWMHDTLDYLSMDPGHRFANHNRINFSISYFYHENFILPFSHDEVVHGKKTIINKLFGTYKEKFAQAKSLYLYMFTHPGKKLNFMGNELAEFREWDESKEFGWNVLNYPIHRNFYNFIIRLNHLYLQESALYKEDYNPLGFQWIDVDNSEKSIYAYKRDDLNGNVLYIVINFSNRYHFNYSLNVKQVGNYFEILNSEAEDFDVEGQVDHSIHHAVVKDGKPVLNLVLKPFSSIILKRLKEENKNIKLSKKNN